VRLRRYRRRWHRPPSRYEQFHNMRMTGFRYVSITEEIIYMSVDIGIVLNFNGNFFLERSILHQS